MISTSQVSKSLNPTINSEDSVFIKFGKVHYQIFRNQIACLYRAEGVFFLIDKKRLKLPLFMNCLEDFPLNLNDNQFFKLTEDVIINRSAVRLSEGLDQDVAVASNLVYTNKFVIPSNTKHVFQLWLGDSES